VVASSPENPQSLSKLLAKLHGVTARCLNRWDGTPGRKVWYQYRDTRISYLPSYYARLKYVHQNAVHHNVAADAENYRWCSEAWFARKARPAFYRTVASFKMDKVHVVDDFEPRGAEDSATEKRRQGGALQSHSLCE